MALIRLGLLGAVAYGIYRYTAGQKTIAPGMRTHDGIAALYPTREQADLAIEHLVQHHGVDRSAIFVEPVDEANTSGATISGGDAPSGDTGNRPRRDAPLAGAIRLTVASSEHEQNLLKRVLNETGASEVQAF